MEKRLSDAAIQGDVATLYQLLQGCELMEKRLYDAAIQGDVGTLFQVLDEDPILLHRTILICEDKNPLHIAAMLDHVEFVHAILPYTTSASSSYMWLARDRDGRNPFHLAAMYGKLAVLQELIQHELIQHAGLQAALEKTDGGGTIFHLCVKHNQLDTLKFLIMGKKFNRQFVESKNDDGMTILHLALSCKDDQIFNYLVKEMAQMGREFINVRNANGETALDLWAGHGGIDDKDLSSLELVGYETRLGLKKRLREWYDKIREALMVVASLIATMAFQAGVSPPGGVWQDDLPDGPNPHRVGEAVIAQTHPKYYRHLIRANSIAFVSSLSTIILLIIGSRIPIKYLMPLLAFVMGLAISTITITYAISLVTVKPESESGQLSTASVIALMVLTVSSGLIVPAVYKLYVELKRWQLIRGIRREVQV